MLRLISGWPGRVLRMLVASVDGRLGQLYARGAENIFCRMHWLDADPWGEGDPEELAPAAAPEGDETEATLLKPQPEPQASAPTPTSATCRPAPQM